jgi:hypothetical protein
LENWVCGLTLIIVTIIFHATSAAFIALAQEKIWAPVKDRGAKARHAFRNWIAMTATVGLLLVMLHGIEVGLWAIAYSWTGALDSFSDAVFYSMDSMTTRGASGLELQHKWRMMGALEGIDGMLLFGISTAFMYAMMQTYWEKLMASNTSQ